MPRGGFGNLIALPLQKGPRERGYSVFVDAEQRPYPDQWAFLASLQPMAAHDIEPTILRATSGIHPLDITFIDDEDLATPWKRENTASKKLPGTMPRSLTMTVANLIYFEKAQLPQPLANRLIRLAAFQNPEFHKAQAMRVPVWDKPRVHLATELLREKSGIAMTHVAYRGAAPAMQDILGGQVPFMMVDTASGNQFVLAGKVKAIGVASAKRIATLPDVPTLAEQGLSDFEAYAWQGLAVPSGTPADTVAKLNKALVDALNSTAVQARFLALGVEGLPGTPNDMEKYVKSERERWGRLIKANNIKID